MNCLSSMFWSRSFSSYPLPPTLKFVGDPMHITAKVWYALTARWEFSHRRPKGFYFPSTILWQHMKTIVKENVLLFIWTSAGLKALKDAEQSRVSLVELLTLCLGGKFVCSPFESSGTCTSTPCSILASALHLNQISPLACKCLCYCRNRGRKSHLSWFICHSQEWAVLWSEDLWHWAVWVLAPAQGLSRGDSLSHSPLVFSCSLPVLDIIWGYIHMQRHALSIRLLKNRP